jgi:hypothetical protein
VSHVYNAESVSHNPCHVARSGLLRRQLERDRTSTLPLFLLALLLLALNILFYLQQSPLQQISDSVSIIGSSHCPTCIAAQLLGSLITLPTRHHSSCSQTSAILRAPPNTRRIHLPLSLIDSLTPSPSLLAPPLDEA